MMRLLLSNVNSNGKARIESGMTDNVRQCTFSARLDCHYLLHVPDTADSRTVLVVTLHGFGQNPETMLHLTQKMFGPQHVIASLQGPNQFFLDAKAQQVGFGWNSSRHTASSIRLHHDMVLHVLHEAGGEFEIPPQRRILAGFSQPVSLNYRLAATFPDAVRGVVAVCGGLPGDWERGAYQPVTAAVLHIARRADEFYPPALTEQYAERLRLRVMDQEFHLIDGGHTMPSGGRVIVEGWLDRILR
jgi:predicted esterase